MKRTRERLSRHGAHFIASQEEAMFVVAVISQKGGSGKTTLSGHLSVQAHLAGDGPAAIIDTDPQGSLAAWWNEREEESPIFIQTSMADLGRHLDAMRMAGVKLVVIDTPPAISSQIHEVIAVADYAIVPTKPSPHDLRAVGATVQLVQSYGKPMVFVLNDASPRAKITYEAAVALSQHGTVAPVTVHHRTIFASSMIDGRTAMEVQPSGPSGREIEGLWEYLNARLNSEILPTSIGMDALNRRDGAGKIEEALAVEPYLSEDGREEDPYETDRVREDDDDIFDDDDVAGARPMPTPEPSLGTIPTPPLAMSPVTIPSAPTSPLGRAEAMMTDLAEAAQMASNDPWKGIVGEPLSMTANHARPDDFVRPARGFGRRRQG